MREKMLRQSADALQSKSRFRVGKNLEPAGDDLDKMEIVDLD